MKPTTNRVYSLCVTALFAAILAVLSPLSIPLPFTPVPLSRDLRRLLSCCSRRGQMGHPIGGSVPAARGSGYPGVCRLQRRPSSPCGADRRLPDRLPAPGLFGRAAHRPFPRAEIHLPLVNDRRNILLLCHWHLVACPASLPLPAWSAGGRGAPLSSGGWGENPRGVCHRLSSAPGPLSEEGEFSPTKKGGLA